MTTLVVAAKDFARAKSRLAPRLDAAARAALAERFLSRALAAGRGARSITRIVVATDAKNVASFAELHGAESALDPPGTDLAAAIDAAVAALTPPLIVLMADLPLVSTADLEAIALAASSHDVAIAPDRARSHTNALGFRGATFPTSFGDAESFRRHRESARARGWSVDVLDLPTVALDVDLPSDLDAYEAFARE